MSPAGLETTQILILKERDSFSKPVRLWNKICIKNSDEFTARTVECFTQCACLIAFSIYAAYPFYIYPLGSEFLDQLSDDFSCFVCRIIQDLDLQAVCWIIQARY